MPKHRPDATIAKESAILKWAVALLALSLAGATLAWQYRPIAPASERKVYFYDQTARRLFAAVPGDLPPIAAPSGEKVGVLAHVFTCGDCAVIDQRVIAWVERYTDSFLASHRRYADIADLSSDDLAGQLLVKKPADPGWTDASIEAGEAIAAAPACPDGGSGRRCVPE